MSSLLQDKVPFLLTLYIGALGWTIAHFVDRVVTSPIIEYEITTHRVKENNGLSEARVVLRNLSRTTSHKDLLIRLRKSSEHATVRFIPFGCEFVAVAPTSLGQKDGTAECDVDVVEFRAELIPPQGTAILLARFQGKGEITVQGGPAKNDSGAYYLAPTNIETLLVRYEFCVLFSILGIWLMLLVAWLTYASRLQRKR